MNTIMNSVLKNERVHPGLKTKLSEGINLIKYEKFDSIFSANIDLIVLGVSSKGIEWVADQLYNTYKGKKLPNLTRKPFC